jgi:hypothetical protein
MQKIMGVSQNETRAFISFCDIPVGVNVIATVLYTVVLCLPV